VGFKERFARSKKEGSMKSFLDVGKPG